MKNIPVFFLISVFLIAGCDENEPMDCDSTLLIESSVQEFPIDFQCTIDPTIEDKYTLDAYALASSLLIEEDSFQVEIPEGYVSNVLKAISAAYSYSANAGDSLEMFDIHHLSANQNYFTSLHLRLSGYENPFDEWVHDGLPTSSCELNELIRMYHLSFDEYQIFNDGNSKSITIISDSFVNMAALANHFLLLMDVLIATPSYPSSNGNSIKTWVENDQLILQFRHGWGDCPSGCIHNRYWTYAVDSQCTVTSR